MRKIFINLQYGCGMFWENALGPRHRRLKDTLEEQRCIFVWSDQRHFTTSAEPLKTTESWLEVWLGDRLLCKAGPVAPHASGLDVSTCAEPLICLASKLLRPR